MDSQFKKRVRGATLQPEGSLGRVAREDHPPQSLHHHGQYPPNPASSTTTPVGAHNSLNLNHTLAQTPTRTTGGAIRATPSTIRTRTRGPPGTPTLGRASGERIGIFGHVSSIAAVAAGTNTRRTSHAGVLGSPSGARKTRIQVSAAGKANSSESPLPINNSTTGAGGSANVGSSGTRFSSPGSSNINRNRSNNSNTNSSGNIHNNSNISNIANINSSSNNINNTKSRSNTPSNTSNINPNGLHSQSRRSSQGNIYPNSSGQQSAPFSNTGQDSGSVDNIGNKSSNIANNPNSHPFNNDMAAPSVGSSSSILRSPGLKSPSKKRFYDRFIPVREGGLSEHYDLLPEAPSTPSRQRTRNMSMTPIQSSQMADSFKRTQNQAHDTVIANELMLTSTQSPYDAQLPSTPRRLFAYSSTTTHNTLHFDSPSRQIYAPTPISFESRKILLSPKKTPRAISKVPFKVLDAPDLRDDFYLNLVDWSSKNVLGVGLGSCVYLWSALTSKVTQLCDLGDGDSVTSLSWISMGSHLAVGTDNGNIQIWDVQHSRRVRTLTGHSQRVGVLAWSDHTLTSGSRDRNIYHRDVRSQEMWQNVLSSHTGEVCGLKWNSSGTQLASGGNDNKLMVWERDSTVPLYKFRDHTAAVKAIDWNPHQAGILASGGGTADRHIRFWNTTTGTAIGATDTGSQVCNLAWSKTTNELVSTHGYSQNQVLVWKYPSMQQIASLSGHTFRVLYLALSPDGQTIVTGAGDETLRFWNVFQKSKAERREEEGLSGMTATLR